MAVPGAVREERFRGGGDGGGHLSTESVGLYGSSLGQSKVRSSDADRNSASMSTEVGYAWGCSVLGDTRSVRRKTSSKFTEIARKSKSR